MKAKGEQVVLHPVNAEFQKLIDSDPVVRMYIYRMIAEVPRTKRYRRYRLDNVEQTLGLIKAIALLRSAFPVAA